MARFAVRNGLFGMPVPYVSQPAVAQVGIWGGAGGNITLQTPCPIPIQWSFPAEAFATAGTAEGCLAGAGGKMPGGR